MTFPHVGCKKYGECRHEQVCFDPWWCSSLQPSRETQSTTTPERLRDIVSTLVVAADQRAYTLDELRTEARDDGDTEEADDYEEQLADLEAAISEAREWLAAVPAGTENAR